MGASRTASFVIGLLLGAGIGVGQYSGTYTIMPSGGDFASHAEAADSLMEYGVVGPCTLEMYTGIYYGQARFDSAGWDSVEVVFRAASGEKPVVEHSSYPWSIRFTDRIKVDGVKMLSSFSYGAYLYRSSRTSFCNCDITTTSHGLYLRYSDTCRIVGNSIRAGGSGIRAEYSGNHLHIVGNDIKAPDSYGLYLYLSAGGSYSYHDTVANNMVYARSYGVYSYHRYYPYLAYNTIWADEYPALQADYNYNCTWLSNIFCNAPDQLDQVVQGSGSIDCSDYNCWFTNASYMAYWSGMGYTWPDWQAAGYDPHGMFREPGVASPLNLHLTADSPCIDSGSVIPEFPTDIDGENRDTLPDIGADEFTGAGQPMAGTYLIHPDPDSGDYNTFNQAISDMILRGYGGDIDFEVAAGTYHEDIFLAAMANGSHSVTFRARNAITDTVPVALRAPGGYAIHMIMVSRFKFRGLYIIAGTYGVYTEGSREKGCDSIVIADCRIDAGVCGMYLNHGVHDCSIVGNVVAPGTFRGIYMCAADIYPQYHCLRNVFANNMIQGWTVSGLQFRCHRDTKLIFNTLHGPGRWGFHDYSGFDGTYHGNIFSGDTHGWYREYGSGPVYCDYNCFWPDTLPIYDSRFGTISLEQWQAFTRLDSHSIYRDPLCVSYRDGHLRSISPCRDSAVNWPGFPLDVDEDVRASPTDIGADDFQLTGSPLNGAYLIHPDPDSGDYNSFYEATCDLMTWGCSGPVVFDVAAGTYQEAVEIQEVAGGYPVTYQARGDEEVVIDANGGPHGIELTGADRVRFRGFTILATDYGVRFHHVRDDGCDASLVECCSLVCRNGVYMDYHTNHCSLVGNHVISGSGYGVYMSGLMDERNLGNVFLNNMLVGTDWGISCSHHDSTKMVYNSVCSRGLYACYDYYGYDTHMQNNIFYASSHAWHKMHGGLFPAVSNFNCFWTDDTGHYVIYHSSRGLVRLAEWQEYSHLDSNSIAADPMFVSATDPHLTVDSPCIDAATSIPGITLDIDGELRDSTPCIGADEVLGTGIEQWGKPLTVDLFRPAPNPASGLVRIRWQVPNPSRVSLKVYNIMGQCVGTLVDGTVEAGVYVTVWRGRDNCGRRLAPGIYFYTFETGNKKLTHKVVLASRK